MHLLSHAVHSDTVASFPVTSLADDPRLEAELADDRRAAAESAAAPFDPLGLYALEQERDEAVHALAANLPFHVSMRLARHQVTQTVNCEWESFEGWVASATTADCSFTLSRQAARPLAAVELLLSAWRTLAPASVQVEVLPDRPRAA